jgi:hypothetical protein
VVVLLLKMGSKKCENLINKKPFQDACKRKYGDDDDQMRATELSQVDTRN